MDLMTVAKQFPEMTVSIRLRDLLDANEALVRKVRAEAEREAARRDRLAGDALVSREDARRRLGSPDPSTLWRWEKAGYLTPVRIGTRVFYRQGDLDALVRAKETK